MTTVPFARAYKGDYATQMSKKPQEAANIPQKSLIPRKAPPLFSKWPIRRDALLHIRQIGQQTLTRPDHARISIDATGRYLDGRALNAIYAS